MSSLSDSSARVCIIKPGFIGGMESSLHPDVCSAVQELLGLLTADQLTAICRRAGAIKRWHKLPGYGPLPRGPL